MKNDGKKWLICLAVLLLGINFLSMKVSAMDEEMLFSDGSEAHFINAAC